MITLVAPQLAAIVKMAETAPRPFSMAFIGTAEMISQPATVVRVEGVTLWPASAAVVRGA